MKKEIGKIVQYIPFKNKFQGRGLRSRLPKRNQKTKVEIEMSERNRKTSEFGQNHHKSEKRLEISKCWKEIRKKIRILEMSERNQKRKSEKRLEISKCPKRNQKSKYMVAVLFDGSCTQLWEKGEKKMILVKSSSCFGFSFVPVHVSFSYRQLPIEFVGKSSTIIRFRTPWIPST